eukprot:gene23916-9487_t
MPSWYHLRFGIAISLLLGDELLDEHLAAIFLMQNGSAAVLQKTAGADDGSSAIMALSFHRNGDVGPGLPSIHLKPGSPSVRGPSPILRPPSAARRLSGSAAHLNSPSRPSVSAPGGSFKAEGGGGILEAMGAASGGGAAGRAARGVNSDGSPSRSQGLDERTSVPMRGSFGRSSLVSLSDGGNRPATGGYYPPGANPGVAHAPNGKMRISGTGGGADVLRLDGTAGQVHHIPPAHLRNVKSRCAHPGVPNIVPEQTSRSSRTSKTQPVSIGANRAHMHRVSENNPSTATDGALLAQVRANRPSAMGLMPSQRPPTPLAGVQGLDANSGRRLGSSPGTARGDSGSSLGGSALRKGKAAVYAMARQTAQRGRFPVLNDSSLELYESTPDNPFQTKTTLRND